MKRNGKERWVGEYLGGVDRRELVEDERQKRWKIVRVSGLGNGR